MNTTKTPRTAGLTYKWIFYRCYNYLFFISLTISISSFSQTPDKLLVNGRIWTGGESPSFVEAIAIRGNKILATGTTAELQKSAKTKTRVIDLQGKLVIPGFNDAHIHFLGGSIGLTEVDLSGASKPEDVVKLVNAFAAKNPGRAWITGRGWQYTTFPGGLPTRYLLEGITEDKPVFLRAYDGHSGWANQKALAAAGITNGFKYEGFGNVVINAQGEPTGALLEHAQQLVSRLVPALSQKEKLDALRLGLKRAASLGITSMQNASGDLDELKLYLELIKSRSLTVRYSAALSVNEQTSQAEIKEFTAVRDRLGASNDLLRVNAVKLMIDGVIESHTAAMLAPYSDTRDGAAGDLAYPANAYRSLVTMLDGFGFQIYTHAIGDKAVRTALDAYEMAQSVNAPRERRHRVEHIETIHPDDIHRFGKLGVLASMEPIHADPGSMEVWSKAIGAERLPWSFAWASLQKEGAMLVYSSDWPACLSLDPIQGIHIAVNRKTASGFPENGWVPEQAISIEKALQAYTWAGAYASFEENKKGKIQPDQLADLVVLSQDLFTIDKSKIHQTTVVMTIFNGEVIYTSPGK